jgi:PTH1 family peptidyl-tRNA hydrolase
LSKTGTSNILIVGLGNPGTKYDGTRHNVGFALLDMLADQWHSQGFSATTKETSTYKSSIFKLPEADVTLLYPLLYMNNSGQAVQEYLRYHDFELEQIYLAHDDLDLELGKFKLQFAKAPKDHNGIISLEQHLNSTQFNRIRIGVNNRKVEQFNGSGADYVLKRFSKKESEMIAETLVKITEELQKTQKT